MSYTGRFAPSPSGPLHAGSLVAALASFLDARAHHGRWLVRIEDIDTPRTVPGADQIILQQLRALGMNPDEPPVWQSRRQALYEQAFARLHAAGLVYGCRCTRRELPSGPYPGTCRPHKQPSGPAVQCPSTHGTRTPKQRLGSSAGASQTASPPPPVRSWRFLVPPGVESFEDRWLGPQAQDVEHEVGDFILKRADGLWAYQLVVVVDDGDQGVTAIVRGADLLDSTARQRQLARAMNLSIPSTLHVPLILDAAGHKLSKQNHAPSLDLRDPLKALMQAWEALGFVPFPAQQPIEFWPEATHRWALRFPAGLPQFAILRPKDG